MRAACLQLLYHCCVTAVSPNIKLTPASTSLYVIFLVSVASCSFSFAPRGSSLGGGIALRLESSVGTPPQVHKGSPAVNSLSKPVLF